MSETKTSAGGHRILTLAHGHPDFSLGGGELAAHNLHKALLKHPDVEDAWFIGRCDRGIGASGSFGRRGPNDYLWEQSLGDSFRMKAANAYAVWQDFRQLLRTLKPTVVHAHHYFHLGLEFLRVVKQENPDIKLMLTLHEYMAICHQQGQMVKRGSNELCMRESFDECHRCIPEFSREQYWLRKQFIQRHFDVVDQFVAPSEFLRQRYIAWGIAPERIVVIENGQEDLEPLSPRPLRDGDRRNRFAFFGQINPFKGVDLLLEAVASLRKKDRKRLVVELHGANLEWQSEQFREKFATLLEPLSEEGCVRWVGPYKPEQLRNRMAKVDWVIVPSIWWENSPLVIQEAFVGGRPVICSNIGGMAEKVQDDVDGLHFEARNPLDLGEVLMRGIDDEGLWNRLHDGIRRPLTHAECADAHLRLCA